MRELNIGISGGTHAHLTKMIKLYGLDISHWNGSAWNRGKYVPRKDIDKVLILRTGPYKEHTRVLLRALLESGVSYECSKCGISKWNDRFIRLQVEHKNGNNLDNRTDNLELLCPNCHSQTKTYGVMRSKRGCDETGRRSGLIDGSLTEKLVSRMLLNSVNPEMATPSQASTEEGVETMKGVVGTND